MSRHFRVDQNCEYEFPFKYRTYKIQHQTVTDVDENIKNLKI